MATVRHVMYAILGMWRPDSVYRCDRCDSWEHDKFYVDDGCWYRLCRACRKADR